MKKMIFGLITLGLLATACKQETSTNENPFFTEYQTPFQTPPFDKIKNEHFLPAFKEGINEQVKNIESIVNNTEEPAFENTIEALDGSKRLLEKVSNVFFGLLGAETNDELQNIAKEVTPLLTKQADDIYLNDKLFAKVKTLYDKKDQLNLNSEQLRLLSETYKTFVNGGANLSSENKLSLRKINEELSMLQLQFEDNILKEDNNFIMVVDDINQLKGLSEDAIEAAKDEAKTRGKEGKFVFTTKKPSMLPFLTYAENRELREKLYKGYINRGNNNNEVDNKKISAKIISLRVQKANLFGFKTYADYVLEDKMAKNSKNVYDLLNKLWVPSLKVAKNEVAEMQELIKKEGKDFKLESWDWWYYSEKVKKEKYALDEEMLKPYFKLENVRDGAFELATKLFGITFSELTNIPVYNKDVKVFEVKESDGSHIGIIYVDYWPRPSKQGGAWMSNFRDQYKLKDKNVTPIVYNVGNFTPPAGNTPSLLTVDEVETLFHEFGHALHGLLSNTTYISLSGANVTRDFVELPSQIMENWAFEPEVMKTYAKHYKTGEVISDELIQKIANASHFNQGFATVEYVAASILDLDLHNISQIEEIDVLDFEKKSMDKIGLINEIIPRYRTTYFKHTMGGGYTAGYYSYIWAAVLDSDAFQAFKEKNDIYHKETALSFRENVLSKGNTAEPMSLYLKFRGKQPSVEPLLKKRGLM